MQIFACGQLTRESSASQEPGPGNCALSRDLLSTRTLMAFLPSLLVSCESFREIFLESAASTKEMTAAPPKCDRRGKVRVKTLGDRRGNYPGICKLEGFACMSSVLTRQRQFTACVLRRSLLDVARGDARDSFAPLCAFGEFPQFARSHPLNMSRERRGQRGNGVAGRTALM